MVAIRRTPSQSPIALPAGQAMLWCHAWELCGQGVRRYTCAHTRTHAYIQCIAAKCAPCRPPFAHPPDHSQHARPTALPLAGLMIDTPVRGPAITAGEGSPCFDTERSMCREVPSASRPMHAMDVSGQGCVLHGPLMEHRSASRPALQSAWLLPSLLCSAPMKNKRFGAKVHGHHHLPASTPGAWFAPSPVHNRPRTPKLATAFVYILTLQTYDPCLCLSSKHRRPS